MMSATSRSSRDRVVEAAHRGQVVARAAGSPARRRTPGAAGRSCARGWRRGPAACRAPRARWTMSSICTRDRPPVSAASCVGRHLPGDLGLAPLQRRARRPSRASRSGRGTVDHLRAGRARVDLGARPRPRWARSGRRGAAARRSRVGGPAREGGDALALGAAAAVRGGEGVRVVDDDRRPSRAGSGPW